MLPAPNRLTRREDFATAVRRGRRVARRTLVVHVAPSPASPQTSGAQRADPPAMPRVGFVVGRSVGGAVTRHRVQRRLRHLMRSRLSELPDGAVAVIRAQPAAAHASSAVLGADLDMALRRLA